MFTCAPIVLNTISNRTGCTYQTISKNTKTFNGAGLENTIHSFDTLNDLNGCVLWMNGKTDQAVFVKLFFTFALSVIYDLLQIRHSALRGRRKSFIYWTSHRESRLCYLKGLVVERKMIIAKCEVASELIIKISSKSMKLGWIFPCDG